jgi:transposase
MANKSITMVEIKRVLQLHLSGSSKLQISKTLGLHRKTIDVYLERLISSGHPLKELLQKEDSYLSGIVYKITPPKKDKRFSELEKMFPNIKQELSRIGVTRRLLWEEYKTEYPWGYGYAQFCEHLSRYLKLGKATMHLEHRPGEYLQIDFAGKELEYVDKDTGEIINCPVLVCTLPFSNFTYVEALASARQEELFAALNRCLNYLGGAQKKILT